MAAPAPPALVPTELGHRPRAGQGRAQGGTERCREGGTPRALEEVGAALPGRFGGFKLGREDSGRERQGVLRGPCPPPASGNWAGRSWKGSMTGSPRCPGHCRVPGVQQGAGRTRGFDGAGQGPWFGVRAGGAALVGSLEDAVCLARGRLAPGAIQGATAQLIPVPEPSWSHAPPQLAPQCLGSFLSAPSSSSSSGASTALSAVPTGGCALVQFLGFFSYSSSLIPTRVPPQTTSIPK